MCGTRQGPVGLGTRMSLCILIGSLLLVSIGLIVALIIILYDRKDTRQLPTDVHVIEPYNKLERIFCPQEKVDSKLANTEVVSNSDQRFCLYGIDELDRKRKQYSTTTHNLENHSKLTAGQYRVLPFHNVLENSSFSMEICSRYEANFVMKLSKLVSVYVMAVRGRSNRKIVKRNIDDKRGSIEAICDGHCMKTLTVDNRGRCDADSTLHIMEMKTYGAMEDYFVIIYNSGATEVPSAVTINMKMRIERVHKNITAMGGEKITRSKPNPNDKGNRILEDTFTSYELDTSRDKTYFVSFEYANDNIGGQLVDIMFSRRCEFHWGLAFALLAGLVVIVISMYACCTLCQGDVCRYGNAQYEELPPDPRA